MLHNRIDEAVDHFRASVSTRTTGWPADLKVPREGR